MLELGDLLNRYITDEDYAVAESNGISKFTVDARVRNLDWPIEKAITQKPRQLNRIPKIVLDSLKKNNISKGTYHTRINVGWGVEEACTVPTGSKPGPNKLRGGIIMERDVNCPNCGSDEWREVGDGIYQCLVCGNLVGEDGNEL